MDQAVVLEEGDETCRRIVEHPGAGGRPDGGRHWHQIVIAKDAGETFLLQIIADRQMAERPAVAIDNAFLVETQDFTQHPQEARREDIALLGEDRAQRRTGPFELAAVE